jgi:hypothetical protein
MRSRFFRLPHSVSNSGRPSPIFQCKIAGKRGDVTSTVGSREILCGIHTNYVVPTGTQEQERRELRSKLNCGFFIFINFDLGSLSLSILASLMAQHNCMVNKIKLLKI